MAYICGPVNSAYVDSM
uniref:Uncharacterized protein n=1 Tax=Arundo donax TaxID=35708 RepID=A0A0A9H279_ARUDO